MGLSGMRIMGQSEAWDIHEAMNEDWGAKVREGASTSDEGASTDEQSGRSFLHAPTDNRLLTQV